MTNQTKAIASAKKFAKEIKKAVRTLVVDSEIIKAASILSETKNRIVTTGMGKAGHIAAKVSSTLSSLGMPSCYVHPGEAAHGDLGMIMVGDIMMAFSTSGKTREVIETIEKARLLGLSKVIAFTCHPDSTIRKMADVVIDAGYFEEAGYLNLAPTTSILMMLIYADMIATMAAEIRGFTLEDFALRHHGGYLGQKARGETK